LPSHLSCSRVTFPNFQTGSKDNDIKRGIEGEQSDDLQIKRA